MSASAPKRYHPFHVTLHWLMAVLIFLALLAGKFVLSPMPSTAAKVGPLSIHSVMGILIAVLFVVRVVARYTLARPAFANENNALLRFVANATHFLLYVGILGMVISGLGMGSMANLPGVFRGDAPIPSDFMQFPPRLGHGLTSTILLALIVLHVAAAFYHQFIVKDNLLARMWYGKK